MVADHPLDAIIQRAPARHKHDKNSKSEVLVIVDCNKREALDRRPLWGEVKYYLVRNTLDGRDPAECEPEPFPVKDIEGDRTVTVRLRCWVSCSPENEKRMAVALCDPNERPAVVFERLLKRWSMDFIRAEGEAEFLDGYFVEPQGTRERLQEHLHKKAGEEAGLNLQVKVRLEGEGGIHKAVEVSTEKFLVSVNDYNERQDLDVNCELELDEQRKINAVIHHKKARNGQLGEKVVEVTKKYFARAVSLDQFSSDLNGHGLLEGLTEQLDRALAAEGRRVGRIYLKSGAARKGGADDEKAPLQFGPHTVEVPVSVQEYPDHVVIRNKLLLSRRSLSLYKANGAPTLDKWVQEKLGRIIPDVLFDAKYIDLLLEFDSLKAEIEARLRAEAAIVGYDVKQLISTPELPPLKWLDPFHVKVEEDFETRQPRSYVKLSIVATARFKTLAEKKIRDYLNRRQDVQKLMRDDIFQLTSQYLHGVEPEQFYTYFYFKDDPKNPDDKTIEMALHDSIKEMLEKKYGAEVIEVIPKMDETYVIINLMILREKPCNFSVSVTPSDGGAPITFRGKFSVEGVNPGSWHVFLSRRFAIDDVREHLEDDVRAKLGTMTEAQLLYKGPEGLIEMEKTIDQIAALSIRRMFGLLLQVTAIDRDRTIVEKKMSDEFVERQLGSIRVAEQKRLAGEAADIHDTIQRMEGIKNLADERLRLGTDAPAAEIEEVEKKLSEEREKLRPDGIAPLADVERVLRPGLPGADRQVKPAELAGAAAEPPDGGRSEGQR